MCREISRFLMHNSSSKIISNTFQFSLFPGLVQEPASQVEEAGKKPTSRALQKRLRPSVQRTHAALRRHVPQLHVQQLGRQGPHVGLPVLQELPLLQLHERQPLVLADHVLAAQLHLLHDFQHGAIVGDGRAGLQPQQPQQLEQPQQPVAQLGGAHADVPLRAADPSLRVQGHL